MEFGPMRARQVAVEASTRAVDTLAEPDYASSFEISTPQADARSPEQWARALFEEAPRALRLFLVFGWRTALGLRLGPRPSADHVLGWRIIATTSDATVLALDSPLITGHNVLEIKDSRILFSTFVRYEHWAAKAIWAMVAPIHHKTIPFLLRHATRKQR
ncbi:DUF2867 domain-containing protein [Actinoallomurus acaciae]|uniref:DUF2867 domain-containing protein n=1 Tax=Actinoallomurus acaciae TaxID=502577 RepID=A0ABV5Y8L9_9ACTN